MRYAALLLFAFSLHAQVPLPPPMHENVIPIYGNVVGHEAEYRTTIGMSNLNPVPVTVFRGEVFPQPGQSCTPRTDWPASFTMLPGETRFYEPFRCDGLAMAVVSSTLPVVVSLDVAEYAPESGCPSDHAAVQGLFALHPARQDIVFPSIPIGPKRFGATSYVNLFFFARTSGQATFTIDENSQCPPEGTRTVTVSGNRLHLLTIELKTLVCGGDPLLPDRRFRIVMQADAPFYAFVSEVAEGHGTFYMPFVPMN